MEDETIHDFFEDKELIKGKSNLNTILLQQIKNTIIDIL